MRKLIWGGVALALLGAVGVYLAALHAVEHPDSAVGRFASATGRLGARLNPFTVIDELASGQRKGPVACESPQAPEQAPEAEQQVQLPKGNPAAEGEEAPEPMEVIQVEDAPAGEAGKGEGVEVCPQQQGPANVAQETREPVRFGVVDEESEPGTEKHAARDACAFMPYAEDDGDTPSGGALSGSDFWRSFGQLNPWHTTNEAPATTAPDVKQDKIHEDGSPRQTGTEQTTPPTKETEQSQIQEDGQKDTDGSEQQAPKSEDEGRQSRCPHEHDGVCPYTGRSYPSGCSSPPVYQTAPVREQATSDLPTTPAPEKLKKKPATQPAQTGAAAGTTADRPTMGVDTLEYRPSDGDEEAFDDMLF